MSGRLETETLDKLYCEISQFTGARTARELKFADLLVEAANKLSSEPTARFLVRRIREELSRAGLAKQ